jgi:hypothetical protein
MSKDICHYDGKCYRIGCRHEHRKQKQIPYFFKCRCKPTACNAGFCFGVKLALVKSPDHLEEKEEKEVETAEKSIEHGDLQIPSFKDQADLLRVEGLKLRQVLGSPEQDLPSREGDSLLMEAREKLIADAERHLLQTDLEAFIQYLREKFGGEK